MESGDCKDQIVKQIFVTVVVVQIARVIVVRGSAFVVLLFRSRVESKSETQRGDEVEVASCWTGTG